MVPSHQHGRHLRVGHAIGAATPVRPSAAIRNLLGICPPPPALAVIVIRFGNARSSAKAPTRPPNSRDAVLFVSNLLQRRRLQTVAAGACAANYTRVPLLFVSSAIG